MNFIRRPVFVSGANNMLERRANPIGRAAIFMIDMVFPRRRVSRPLYLPSANGEVLARCSTEPMTGRLFRAADLINADGQPLVTASRFTATMPVPERAA